MRSASLASSCLSAMSIGPMPLTFFPQQPGSFPTGSHPRAFTMSLSLSACSMAEHPGSRHTLGCDPSSGRSSRRLWMNGMRCSQEVPWRFMISLHPPQSVTIGLPSAVSPMRRM